MWVFSESRGGSSIAPCVLLALLYLIRPLLSCVNMCLCIFLYSASYQGVFVRLFPNIGKGPFGILFFPLYFLS